MKKIWIHRAYIAALGLSILATSFAQGHALHFANATHLANSTSTLAPQISFNDEYNIFATPLQLAQTEKPKFLPPLNELQQKQEDEILEEFFKFNDGRTPFLNLDTLPLLKFALLLPTEAEGLSGNIARDFRRGCAKVVEGNSERIAIDLYVDDGNTAQLIHNYNAAAQSGVVAIVTGILKSRARAISAAYPQSLLPTLLLQQSNNESYYVMTLDESREAADLARQLQTREDVNNIFLIEQNNARGWRQRAAFESEMYKSGIALTLQMRMDDTEEDMMQLFELMKDAEPTPIFIAGAPSFVIRARSFLPARHSVFSMSLVNNSKSANPLTLNNLAFMEMPWFLQLPENLTQYDSSEVRLLPLLRQRFFAFGVDVCRALLEQPQWYTGWTMSGVSGDWRLENNTFVRDNDIAIYRNGQLRQMQP